MKILIWGEPKLGGPYDIFRKLDEKKVYREIISNCGGVYNVGNKVWIQGLVSGLSTDENELFFYNPEESWDYINSFYDKIVYSAANMLCEMYVDLIETVSDIFINSKIPVYVIAIGTQANSYSDLPDVVNNTKEAVSRFMETIYETGGEIACRGYFTKEYLDLIAKNSAVVTGCPSLFQNGRGLRLEKKRLDKTIYNGNAITALDIYDKQSIYIDQDIYLSFKYDLADYDPDRYLAYMIYSVGKKNVKRFLNGEIEVFLDMAEWHKFLIDNEFSFSIGSRIHGNIMSILSGIPAVIYGIDTRTREMAEFYHIPMVDNIDQYKHIQELYEKINFDTFNDKYSELFDAYESFLINCGLVEKINQTNAFWGKETPINKQSVIEKREKLKSRFNSHSLRRQVYYRMVDKHSKALSLDFSDFHSELMKEVYDEDSQE